MKKLLASLVAVIVFLLILALPGPQPLAASPCPYCVETCYTIGSGSYADGHYWIVQGCHGTYECEYAGDWARYMDSRGVIQYWPY